MSNEIEVWSPDEKHRVIICNEGISILKEFKGRYKWIKYDTFFKQCCENDKLQKLNELKDERIKLLESLILLTHPSVSDREVGDLSLLQWSEYIKEFSQDKNE